MREYGIATGYYVDCDSALCADCAPDGFAKGDYSEWAGFEGWESPGAIFIDTESDTPTHCSKCKSLIPHDLTCDGLTYVANSITEHLASDPPHTGEVMLAWWNEYDDQLSHEIRAAIGNRLENMV